MTELQIQESNQEARDLNRDPITGTPGAHPVGTGIGAAGGAAAGVAVGTLAGPVGTAVGGVVGAIVGGLAGKGLGEAVNPTTGEIEQDKPSVERFGGPLDPAAEELYWQRAFITEPYYNSELTFDDYGPAYRAGFLHRHNSSHRSWEESEDFLHSVWERSRDGSSLDWEDAKLPMRAAWHRANSAYAEGDPYFGVS